MARFLSERTLAPKFPKFMKKSQQKLVNRSTIHDRERKKHKRGERGSTDEEIATPKRSNMATSLGRGEDVSLETHQPTNEQQKPEPTLLELHEMLVDIQINVNNILRENKEIRNEMEGLKFTVSRQTNEISTLKTHLQKMDNQYQEIEKQLYAAKRHVEEQQEEISELYDLQDKLEQYTRKNSLEIHGVPESAYSSTEEVVLKLAEALQVPINPVDIEISHKLNRKGNKPIMAKFVSHKTKTSLFKVRVNLRNIKLPNLFPGTHSPESKDRICIYESLTSYRKKIVNEANTMRRNGELLKVWTMEGQIYVKTSPDGRPIRIRELDDLKSL